MTPALWCSLLSSVMLVPLTATIVSADPTAHTVVVADCLHPGSSVEYKPSRFVVACGGDAIFTLRAISYMSWRQGTAHATATQRYNSCSPDCAAGNLISRHVMVKLFKPRLRHGRRSFACMVLTGGTDESYTLLGQRHASACQVSGHIAG